MQYECKEAVTLNGCGECSFFNSKNLNLPESQMKKFMLDKVMPVAAHITALLIGLGIVIIFSHFIK